MSEETVEAEVREFAARTGVTIWEGIPWGGATTLSPESLGLEDFLAIVQTVGTPIVYLDPDGDVIAFAADGVVHVFATPDARARLTGGDAAEDGDARGDGEEEPEVEGISIRVSGDRDFNDPYYDWQSGTRVSGRVRDAVDALVADQRFDGHRNAHVLAEYVSALNADEADIVDRVAGRVFHEGIGKQLDHRATQLVQSLVNDPTYDPLAWGDELRLFIGGRVDEVDPRLIERVKDALGRYSYDSGARTKAERALTKRAETLLLALPPLVRDTLGFTSKNAAKLQVLAPHLEGESEGAAERLAKEVARLEEDRFRLSREGRYATAARRLLADGMTRAEVSRRLGVSTSVLDRIITTHRRDVELAEDDPIVTDLAPGAL